MAAEQILQYLNATRRLCLKFNLPTLNGPTVHAATDAAFADAPGCRSSQGLVIFLHSSPVIWQAHYQPTVASSTTEAELTTLSTSVKELIAFQRLLHQLKVLPN